MCYVMLSCNSLGMCRPYPGQIELCDNFINTTSYVYIIAEETISDLRSLLADLSAGITLATDQPECQTLVANVICSYYFPPCGSVNGVHLPLALCETECNYVRGACPSLWEFAQSKRSLFCNETTSRFQGVSLCCSDGGIIITGKWISSSMVEHSTMTWLGAKSACVTDKS